MAVPVGAFLAYQLYGLLVYSEFFRVERIEVYGCQQSTPESILARLPWVKGDSLWTISLKESVDGILTESWVKSVTVRRVLPRRVEVYIQERVPIAAVPDSQGLRYYGIDERGYVLPMVSVFRGVPHLHASENSPRLPIVTGFKESEIEVGKALPEDRIAPVMELVGLIQAESPQLAEVLFEYNASQKGNVVAYPSERVKKINFGTENFSRRIARLAKVWKYLESQGHEGEYLDLRFEDQCVVFSPNATPSEGSQMNYSRDFNDPDGAKNA